MLPLLEELRQLEASEVVSPDDRMMQTGPLGLQHYLIRGPIKLVDCLECSEYSLDLPGWRCSN
jgi:hypothetical protein